MKQSKSRSDIQITVGHKDADIVGNCNRAIQAAVDYLHNLGGGTVEIGPETFTMRDSLHLRSGVSIRGQGESTILAKSKAVESPLTLDGDYGEEQVTLASPDGFEPGGGISITDDRSGGFHTVVGTICWKDGDTFGVSTPMQADYLVSRNARAATTFPVVSGYHVSDVKIDKITVDGNGEHNPHLNGCRGAGIFLYRGHGTVITECTVRDYSGDGISFQQSDNVHVYNCSSIGNSHLGLHPGSGSGSPVIKRCHASKNGQIGLFLCWRVKHGVFKRNDLVDNGNTGISIGHKDTDNVFKHNRITNNGREGILFRDESEPMAGHRNKFRANTILDNGTWGVRIQGATHDLTFIKNRIGNTADGKQRFGISIGQKADRIALKKNDLSGNLDLEIEDQRQ